MSVLVRFILVLLQLFLEIIILLIKVYYFKNKIFYSSYVKSLLIKKFPSNTALAFFLEIDLQLFSLALNKKPWVFGDDVFKHHLSLLIPTYSLLISSINLTAYLQ